MKITDVTLTLFGWDDIPATTYGRHTGKFGGKSQLGLLAVQTDEGVVGHAFLGSAQRGAHLDGESLITALKPHRHGPGPARPGAPLPGPDVEGPPDHAARDRRRRHRALGHRGQGREPAHPPAARLLSRPRAGLCQLGGARHQAGLRGGGGALQERRLDGVQDPPAHRSQGRHRDLPGGARHGGRRLHRHARLDVGVRLSRGDPRGTGDPGAAASTGTRTRWPTTTSTTTSSSSSSSTSRSSPPSTRRAASPPMRPGSSPAPPTICAATSRSRAGSRRWSRPRTSPRAST